MVSDEEMKERSEAKDGMTYGQKAVGLTFNPSGDKNVQKVKELYAEIIDLCKDLQTPRSDNESSNERSRILAVAITQAQTAQMWAVKGITFKF